MKKLLFTIVICSFPLVVISQSLSIEVKKGSNNSLSTFILGDGSVTMNAASISFSETNNELRGIASYGVSADLSLVGTLSEVEGKKQATILSDTGTMLTEYEVSDFSASDPSLQVYPLNNGGVLIRDNIVSFNLYNPFGKTGVTASGGGQSSGGQVISEVAKSSAGNTIIVYTPQIKNGGSRGSNAGRLSLNGQLESIYSSGDRTIKDLQVSADGQFVSIITAKPGIDDEILVLDKYGNQISKMESSENLKSTSLSASSEHVTIYSAGRAAVYNMISGERIGSTSFGSSLIKAQYFSDDQILVALSGSLSGDGKVANNLEFHAIHFEKRQVERKEYRGSIGFNPMIDYHFRSVGSGKYHFTGANKLIEISAQF